MPRHGNRCLSYGLITVSTAVRETALLPLLNKHSHLHNNNCIYRALWADERQQARQTMMGRTRESDWDVLFQKHPLPRDATQLSSPQIWMSALTYWHRSACQHLLQVFNCFCLCLNQKPKQKNLNHIPTRLLWNKAFYHNTVTFWKDTYCCVEQDVLMTAR